MDNNYNDIILKELHEINGELNISEHNLLDLIKTSFKKCNDIIIKEIRQSSLSGPLPENFSELISENILTIKKELENIRNIAVTKTEKTISLVKEIKRRSDKIVEFEKEFFSKEKK